MRIGRDPSVVSRDVARHGGRAGYRAVIAEQTACAARERPKLLAVERSPRLRAVVCRQLRCGWSPGSIAGRLPADYPEDQACRVSHEAIYQWVYAQPVSTLARELISLRTGRKARQRASATPRRLPDPDARNGADQRDRPPGGQRRFSLLGGLSRPRDGPPTAQIDPAPPLRQAAFQCHPVDLAQSDRAAARGRPSTQPPADVVTLRPRAVVW